MTSFDTLFSQNPVFRKLTPARREALIQQAVIRRCQKGDVIAQAGDFWHYLFFVAQGGVQAVKQSLEGRSLVVTTFLPGDIFWGLAFFYEDMAMPVALEATSSTLIYLWSSDQLHPLLKKEGEVSWELARLMIHKMARASEILEEMTFQPVAGRLAKLLTEAGQGGAQGTIARSLTLDEMAARIGSTREMVCRLLHRFQDENMIDITRTEYRITNQELLAMMAQKEKG